MNTPSDKALYALLRDFKIVASSQTSNDPDSYAESCGSLWGHCVPVSLVVQDLYGGTLKNGLQLHPRLSHYWNVLPDGREIDLTAEQFAMRKCWNEVSDQKQREYVLSFPETKARYELFRDRYLFFIGREKYDAL